MNLSNHFLIAMPSMHDPIFGGSVVYLCEHNERGALGVVINKPMDITIGHLLERLNLNLEIPAPVHKPVMFGGPVQEDRGFVLHSTDYIKPDTVVIDDKIAVSSSIDIITDIAFGTGPKENLIALGYASWAPQQLENEIVNNSWLVANPTPELVFRTKDEEKWQKAIESLGIDLTRLVAKAGHA